jgi:hypothetical protein
VTPPAESWFDRLAARPLTRRQGLRAAAIGTAAAIGASLPFARSLPTASAASDSDCRRGCVYTANRNYASTLTEDGVFGFSVYTKLPLLGPAGPLVGLVLLRKQFAAYDRIVSNHRILVANCFQPNCPGFDPKAPGGPCSSCEASFFCNPCAALDEGYVCCIYSPTDCHGDCCPTTVAPGCP